jgi:hypothetical protein
MNGRLDIIDVQDIIRVNGINIIGKFGPITIHEGKNK